MAKLKPWYDAVELREDLRGNHRVASPPEKTLAAVTATPR
jgi:hypothetical protein